MRWSSSASSRLVGAEQQRGLGLAQVSGFLEDRRDLGVGDELRPPVLVPVEQRPDPVLLGGVAEHRRALRAVERALLGALRAEHLQESVDVLDGRRCQDHDCSPSDGSLRISLPPTGSVGVGSFSGRAAGAASVDLPISAIGAVGPSAGDGVVDDLVLDRPAGRRGAAGDADLRVDVLDVVLGGPRRDEQLRRDLAGGSAVGDEAEHLDLAPAQAAGPRLARPRSSGRDGRRRSAGARRRRHR